MENVKQIFLSIPMTGCLEESRIKDKEAKEKLKDKFPDYNIISGFDILDDEEHNDSYYMGIDVKNLMESQIMISMPGWQQSKGCKVERYIAYIYDIKIINYESLNF